MKNLKATDTVHVSSVQADPIRPGETFQADDGTAKQLVDRGLATLVRAPKKPAAKKAAAPANKAAPAPANKAAGADETK